jgi:hypothetical protein
MIFDFSHTIDKTQFGLGFMFCAVRGPNGQRGIQLHVILPVLSVYIVVGRT